MCHLPHGPVVKVRIEGVRARKHAQEIRCAAHVPLAELAGKAPRAVEAVLKAGHAVDLEVFIDQERKCQEMENRDSDFNTVIDLASISFNLKTPLPFFVNSTCYRLTSKGEKVQGYSPTPHLPLAQISVHASGVVKHFAQSGGAGHVPLVEPVSLKRFRRVERPVETAHARDVPS